MGVPTTATVVPGAAVSIVLKADQRSGRQVQGIVQDLLTKGNHPRGIKVRLADSRIGRVQRMVEAAPSALETPEAQRAAQVEVQRDLATQQRVRGPDGGSSRGGGYRSERLQNRYTDMRLDEAAEQPPEQLDLMAFVKQPKQKKRGAKALLKPETESQEVAAASGEVGSAKTATCPVCGIFEGDEAAVAHHVEGHFS